MIWCTAEEAKKNLQSRSSLSLYTSSLQKRREDAIWLAVVLASQEAYGQADESRLAAGAHRKTIAA